MQRKTTKPEPTVAERLRPVAFLYAALNIAVVALLVTTVSPTPETARHAQEMASLR